MELLRAAEIGDVQQVRALLDTGVGPDHQKNNSGWTPLILASKQGHRNCAELLLSRRANPNIQDRLLFTPLYYASRHGNRDCAELLLGHKADPNQQSKGGWTPLHVASLWGNRDCAELLLGRKADPNLQDENGQTARDLAKKRKHESVVALLHCAMHRALTARHWCRIFAAPDRFLGKSTGNQKMLINFFIQYPGLRRVVGGAMTRFYDPCTADCLNTSKKSDGCIVM